MWNFGFFYLFIYFYSFFYFCPICWAVVQHPATRGRTGRSRCRCCRLLDNSPWINPAERHTWFWNVVYFESVSQEVRMPLCACVRSVSTFNPGSVFKPPLLISLCIFYRCVFQRVNVCTQKVVCLFVFSWSLCATACRGVATSQSSQVTVRSRDHEWRTGRDGPRPSVFVEEVFSA